MRLLAIDLSSAQGSVALLENGELREEMCWRAAARTGQPIFSATPRLLQRHGWAPDDLDAIAVGRGPGSYTGLRMAIAYAQGLAMPRSTSLYAVKSSEALAHALSEAQSNQRIFVVGDARRGTLWVHEFERTSASEVKFIRDISVSLAQVDAVLPSDALAVSPDWDRLVAAGVVKPGDTRWITGNRYPRAAEVGLVAAQRLRAGIPSEPLLPIYTHPAVAAKTPANTPPVNT